MDRRRKWRLENPDKDRAIAKRYRTNHPKEVRERHVAYLSTPARRLRKIIGVAFFRAKHADLSFEAGLIDVLPLNAPTHCLCCGKLLDYSLGRGRRNRRDSPSLDRFDNSGGYTVANTKIICMRCNEVKRDSSIAEMELIIAYMKRYSPEKP